MKIYHYTNIEALALILKNQTIRFNRLDKVDDIEEGNAESWGVKFCKYVFGFLLDRQERRKYSSMENV